jgi:hypothetical protein
MRATSAFQFRLAFLHALITHRFMFRRVGFDLRAIQRDMAGRFQPCRLAQIQNVQEQRAERLRMPLVLFAAGLRDPPRRIQPTRILLQKSLKWKRASNEEASLIGSLELTIRHAHLAATVDQHLFAVEPPR